MNLKSGDVFWPQIYRGPELQFRELDQDITCEIAIIGGGISGALAAYYLTRAGFHVVLLDRRPIAHGSTAASTGLLQYEIDVSLVDLIGKLGRERAVAAYLASVESVRAFEPLVAELDDSCELLSRPSVYLASEEKDVSRLKAECEARQSIGIDVKFLCRDELREYLGVSRLAALLSHPAFEVDPFRLTLALIRGAIKRGLRVFSPVNIVRHESNERGAILHTNTNARINAGKIIFATGYETMGLLPSDLCALSSTYAICSEPVEITSPWKDHCLIWESARPYLYLRPAQGNRIMVGGEDENIVDPHLRDQLIGEKTRKLVHRFSELFPQIKLQVACAWAGTFAQTDDGLPFIGARRDFPHCYFALGYGGNGITFSLIAAELIRDLLLGYRNPKIDLFRFDR